MFLLVPSITIQYQIKLGQLQDMEFGIIDTVSSVLIVRGFYRITDCIEEQTLTQSLGYIF